MSEENKKTSFAFSRALTPEERANERQEGMVFGTLAESSNTPARIRAELIHPAQSNE